MLDTYRNPCYNKYRKRERKKTEDKKMAKSRTQGWYTFADGYRAWYHGMDKTEKKWEIIKHGKIVKFEAT